MPPKTIESRVDNLERRVPELELETLPDRITAVELQIVQLRTEMRGEFSAVREETRSGDEETRHVLGVRIDETARVLGERIDENGRHMRVLHEEVIGRLAIIQEGQSAPRRRRRQNPAEVAGLVRG